MTTQTGPEYIKHCRELGFSDTEISAEMRRVGWQDIDIHAAFSQTDRHTKGTKKGRLWLWIIVGIVVLVVLGALATVTYFTLLA